MISYILMVSATITLLSLMFYPQSFVYNLSHTILIGIITLLTKNK